MSLIIQLSQHLPWRPGPFSSSPNVTWDTVQANPQIFWSYRWLSANPNITWAIVQANPNYAWRYERLSRNPNITWEIIRTNPQHPWSYLTTSSNPNMLWTTLAEHFSLWDFIALQRNLFNRDSVVRKRLITAARERLTALQCVFQVVKKHHMPLDIWQSVWCEM